MTIRLCTAALALSVFCVQTTADAREIPAKGTVLNETAYYAEVNRLLENIHYEAPTQWLLVNNTAARPQAIQYSPLARHNLNATGNSIRRTTLLTADDAIQNVTLSYLTLDTFEEREQAQEQLDQIARQLYVTHYPKTTYAVVDMISRYIAENYTYSFTPPNGKSPYVLSHFLQTNIGVCQAYAALASELLHRFGIANQIITGTISQANGAAFGHAWVGIELDGSWYHFDPTWNDTDNEYVYSSYYLALPTSAIAKERTMDIVLPEAALPAPTATPYTAAHFNEAMQAYTEAKWQRYIDHYWLTIDTRYTPLQVHAMHVEASRTYILRIEPAGEVSVIIDDVVVNVNDVPPAIVQRIILPADGYMKNEVRYIPFTSEAFTIALTDESPFTDIAASYAKPMIIALYELGYIKGVTATTFEPKTTLTKGHVVSIVSRYLGQPDSYATSDSVFGNHWATNHYYFLQQQGIILKQQADFYGYSPMTRAEAAELMYRFLQQQGRYIAADARHFDDRHLFATAAQYEAALALRHAGILDGNQRNQFNPNSSLTREQFAKIFYNSIQ